MARGVGTLDDLVCAPASLVTLGTLDWAAD